MGTPSRPRFDRLEPSCPDYARLPVAAAFTWDACTSERDAGEWYLVAFRSRLRPGADCDRLHAYDDRAHEEAARSPGFVHYFKGPVTDLGDCLSFCVWTSRAEARAASGGPAHREAIGIAHGTYERYTLEFIRLTKRLGASTFEFEPYDAAPAMATTSRRRPLLAAT